MKLAYLEDLKNYRNILVLTHNDLDATGAPVVLQYFRESLGCGVTTKYFSNADMKEGIKKELTLERYKDTELNLPYDLIIIVDISTDEEDTIQLIDSMYEDGQAIVLIDHHKTSEMLAVRDWCIHDTTKSASLLFWELVQEDLADMTKYFLIMDKYIDHVNDWDMWHWAKDGYSKGTLSPMFSGVLDVIGVRAFVELTVKAMLEQNSLEFNLPIHETIYKTKLITDESKYKNLLPTLIEVPAILNGDDQLRDEYKIILGYCDSLNPGIVSKRVIAELNADIVIMFSSTSVSYRKSDTCKFSILDIAVKYGGGGHPQACGSPREKSLELYAYYYKACREVLTELLKVPYTEKIVEVPANTLKLNDLIIRSDIKYFVVDNEYSKQIDKCVVVQSLDGSDIKRIYHGAPVQKITTSWEFKRVSI